MMGAPLGLPLAAATVKSRKKREVAAARRVVL
jgi:hypothetical protein